jgi:hypothetical protein
MGSGKREIKATSLSGCPLAVREGMMFGMHCDEVLLMLVEHADDNALLGMRPESQVRIGLSAGGKRFEPSVPAVKTRFSEERPGAEKPDSKS